MVYKLEHYQELAKKMIKRDKQRELNNEKYDNMDHVDWTAPPKLKELMGFRADPSTDPHDAISTMVRVLSAQDERVTLQPLAPDVDNKNKATERERVLKWLMDQVNRRRQGTVQKSVIRSSGKYDEICALVVDLDEQIKNKEVFEGDTKREKAARRYGRFMVNTYHPNEVHVTHSNMMPESVLLVQKRKAKEVMNEWGKLASKLKDLAEDDGEVTYYDYMDYDDHVIWCTGDRDEEVTAEIMNEEHKLPFLPWVARVGGDMMEPAAEHRRRPLLYSIMQSDSWHTMNVARSLETSEIMYYAMAPRTKEESPLGGLPESTTKTDYGGPGKTVLVTPGHTLDQMQPPGPDPGLRQLVIAKQAEMAKSTVANVLQGGDVAPGEAFASLNLRTQTAVGALKPAKELAEYALADIYTLFLLYAHYTETDIMGYGTEKADLGQEYKIPWNEIDPEAIYLSVELTPDVPLDRQQKANTAMMMLQRPGFYSKERALEDMGVTDPDQVMEEAYMEQLMEARITDIVQTIMAQGQLAIQQQQMEMQGIQQQQLAAQAQGLAAQQNQGANVPGGEMFNPAMGGQIPQEVAPGATREGVTGEDRMANEAAMGMGGVI